MPDDGGRHIEESLIRSLRAQAPVHVLVVSEEVPVQKPYPAQRIGPEHQAAARDEVRRPGCAGGVGRRGLMPRFEGQSADRPAAVPDSLWGRKLVDDGAVRRGRLGFRRALQLTQTIGIHDSVVVEEQYEVESALQQVADADVVALGEAEVRIVYDQGNLRVPSANVVRGPVRGGVINNDNLIGRAGGAGNRVEAARRDLFPVPVQDDEAELHCIRSRNGTRTAGFYAARDRASMTSENSRISQQI